MASDKNFIAPEQRVATDVGKLLTDHFSFLEELRRKSAALPDEINVHAKENTPLGNYCKPNNKLNSK
jgi:hypothetical protein